MLISALSQLDVLVEINHTCSKPNVTATFTNDLDIRFIRPGIGDTIVRFDVNDNSNTFTVSNIGPIASSILIDPENWVINQVGSIVQSDELSFIEAEQNNLNLSIYPNPSHGTFQINGLAEKAELTIYDLKGKERKNISVLPNEIIDIKNLGEGSYIIEIQLHNNIKKFKIITI